jgi:hypothetical protein
VSASISFCCCATADFSWVMVASCSCPLRCSLRNSLSIRSAWPAATIRVYVNIGMFSEYWLTRHNRLIGLVPQKPFEIPYAREHSVFWRATEERLANVAAFFRKA